MDGTPRRPILRTPGRDGPEQRGGIFLMSIHRSHMGHIAAADQGRFALKSFIRESIFPK
jgi:hypothetical protein